MKKLLLSISIISIITLIGCATSKNLETGGVYNGDAYLYNIDATIVSAYDTVDSFLVWEMNNNAYLKINAPTVFDIANKIRDNAPTAIKDITKARSLYVSYFHDTNASLAQFTIVSNNLQQSVSILQSTASIASSAVISTSLTNNFNEIQNTTKSSINTILNQ